MPHNLKTSLAFKYSIFFHKCMPYIDSPPFPYLQNKQLCPSVASSVRQSWTMVPQMEKPRVTEIRVRMDCNGCVQKIKKALHGITGIYDLYIDFPQQKITIIGWADPAKIVKAIKKTKKTAIICSHTEQPDQPVQEPEPEPEGEAPEGGAPPPPPESINPPTEQAAPPEAPSPPDNPPPPPPPTPEGKPSQESANERETSQSTQPSKPKEPEEIHVIHHHPPNYGYQYGYGHYNQEGNSGMNPYPSGPGFRGEPPQPVYVTHSYNTYKPSPYVTEYAYPQPPPTYSHYSRPDHYSQGYYSGNSSNGNVNGNGNGNITFMFSEENPNACNIV